MTDPSPTKGERTRKGILEAAYELFLTQGYAASSMRQIANRAGLALGGIYNHFESKEAIFSELVLERHPYRQVLPILLTTPADDPESFVRLAAKMMVEELGRRPDFLKLMMIELVEFNGRDMPGIVERIIPEVVPLIQKFNNQQRLLRNIPPFIFFRAFVGLFFSYYITDMMIPAPASILNQEDALEHFIDIFLHGILAETEKA